MSAYQREIDRILDSGEKLPAGCGELSPAGARCMQHVAGWHRGWFVDPKAGIGNRLIRWKRSAVAPVVPFRGKGE